MFEEQIGSDVEITDNKIHKKLVSVEASR